ncbi:hypothetical protein AB0D65_29935 [Streptomyces griseoloalbus]|uniref:Uncharacterized protein n=1 Tax=Streptomyces griseoloalbus TaxID=67303 RepID=A0ABV3EEQ0_9ACTN
MTRETETEEDECRGDQQSQAHQPSPYAAWKTSQPDSVPDENHR